jgi:lipoprotein-anchoring transpeptidase ErfK/SrfK
MGPSTPARFAVRLLLGSIVCVVLLCAARTADAAAPSTPLMTHPGHWVLVNLATQHLYAYDGATLARDTAVSTGIAGHETPVGSFTVQRRFLSQEMKGTAYDLPNVPYVQYFGNGSLSWQEGYSLHGTYWHHNFGHVMSHGCVNLPTDFAAWLWNWAGVGTPVEIVSGA